MHAFFLNKIKLNIKNGFSRKVWNFQCYIIHLRFDEAITYHVKLYKEDQESESWSEKGIYFLDLRQNVLVPLFFSASTLILLHSDSDRASKITLIHIFVPISPYCSDKYTFTSSFAHFRIMTTTSCISKTLTRTN